MDYQVDVHELTQMGNRYANAKPIIRQELSKGLAKCAIVVQSLARQLVHVKTGRLRASIVPGPVKTSGDGLSVEIGTNVVYAPYVEFGTAAHVILPVTKKALYWQGADHPVRSVNHPGSKAYPYLKPALQQSIGKIDALMGAAVSAAMARIGGGR